MALHRFAVFTAAATLCLLIAGGLVTSFDAGLSVPDWPLSYGQLMPPMIGGIFYEHGHRMIASFVGVLTIVLAVWLWRSEPRRAVRRLGWVALGAVILQGTLGGMTVLFLLPTAISVGHACLAQLFFTSVVTIAWLTSRRWREHLVAKDPSADDGAPALRHLVIATNVAIFLQLMLGATLRHKGLGVVPHLVGAGAVAVLVGWVLARVATKHPSESGLVRGALALNLAVMVQLVLGASTYWIRTVTADAVQPLPPMVLLTVAHLAVGALILAASVVYTVEVHRRVGKPAEFPARGVAEAA